MTAEPPKLKPCDDCITKVEQANGPLPVDSTNEQQGARYRLWQAEHLLHLFRDTHDREPASLEELGAWDRLAARARSQEEKP